MSETRVVGRRGFTLVELLVVIGIIALLISILLPALNKAKVQSQKVACMSNQRQMATAWIMYGNDFKDYLPLGHPDGGTTVTADPTGMDKFIPWFVGASRASSSNWPAPPIPGGGGNTEGAIKRGSVWPYLKSIKVFRCAGDPGVRLVSYGINNYLNGEGFGDVVLKRSKVRHHTKTFVTIDEYDLRGMESSTGYNLGSFGLDPYPATKWVDYPGMYHLNASVVSFLDGHAELLVWDVPSTKTITGNSFDASSDPRDIRKLQKLRGGAAADKGGF
jgi:prepilin-type N-terminal cleavage/methylation domain-containing protein